MSDYTLSSISSDSDDDINSSAEPWNEEAELEKIEAEYNAKIAAIDAKYARRNAIAAGKAHRAGVASGSIPAPVPRDVHDRKRHIGLGLLMGDYFNDNCTYGAHHFRRRFRMRRSLFYRILEGIQQVDPRFKGGPDCTGKEGFTGIQQLTGCIFYLATGNSTDSLDDRVRMAASTLFVFVDRFVDAIAARFGAEYMRKPNDQDFHTLMQQADARGFPGMLGSIDCMHWTWTNCPMGWQGQYTNAYHGSPSVILEAVAGPDTWLWHSFFGVSGANNDLNVLQRSPVLEDMMNETGPQYTYTINGREYNHGYFLGDGIYPNWSCFVKSMRQPVDHKQKFFKKRVDNYRKDIERAFGILQARWHIIKNPARISSIVRMTKIMHACIIMHNMIVEDERGHYRGMRSLNAMMAEYDGNEDFVPVFDRREMNSDEHFIATNVAIKNRAAHTQLQNDLVQHLWGKLGHLYRPE